MTIRQLLAARRRGEEATLEDDDRSFVVDVVHAHDWVDARGHRWLFGIARVDGGKPFVICDEDDFFEVME